jgi:hypothetical protein
MRRDSGHLVDESSSWVDDGLIDACDVEDGGRNVVAECVYGARVGSSFFRLGGAYAHRMDVLLSKGGLDDETRPWLDTRRTGTSAHRHFTHTLRNQKAGQQQQ